MSTHDVNGREYARLSLLKVGDKVECDDGFTCNMAQATREVKRNKYGDLFIDCDEGGHTLNGQLSGVDNDHIIGVYKS